MPPEECEFFITSVGIADTDKIELPKKDGIKFEVENLYEENGEVDQSESLSESKVPLTSVKGIGKGFADNLKSKGINDVTALIGADPEELASQISGISSKKVIEMQDSAKKLVKA